MIKDFLDDVMDWIMDYLIPILVIGSFAMLGVMILAVIFDSGKPTLEQTVKTCIMKQREEDSECKFAILKYTRKQNHTTVIHVPMVITHK